jgi:FkbM family methyltransferase
MINLVYDVGMHLGEDAHYYLTRGYRVIGVEANPILIPALRARFSNEIDAGRLTIVDKGISDTPGTARFAINDKLSIWGSLSRDFIDRNTRRGAPSNFVDIQCVRFDDLLNAHGIPDYLKIDIEGADMLCIDALRRFPDRPQYISIESCVSSPGKGVLDALSEISKLTALGYRKFKFIEQSAIPGTSIAFIAPGGELRTYAFPEHSSGPFGEDIPGEWVNSSTARSQAVRLTANAALLGHKFLYRALPFRVVRRARWALKGGGDPWYDLHATRD